MWDICDIVKRPKQYNMSAKVVVMVCEVVIVFETKLQALGNNDVQLILEIVIF